jgi:hypothetical protein
LKIVVLGNPPLRLSSQQLDGSDVDLRMEPVAAKQPTLVKNPAIPSLNLTIKTSAVFTDQTGLLSSSNNSTLLDMNRKGNVSSDNPKNVFNYDDFTTEGSVTNRFNIVKDSVATVKDSLIVEEDSLPFTTDSVSVSKDSLSLSKDIFSLSKDSLSLSKDSLPLIKDILSLSKDSLPLSKDSLPLIKDTLSLSKDSLSLSKDSLPASKDSLPTSKDSLDQFEAPQPSLWSWTEGGPVPKSRLLITKKNRLSELFSSSEEEQAGQQHTVRVHANIASYEIG